MKKKIKTAKSAPTEFYVVSWAEKDNESDSLTSGTFMDIYSTARKARNAVMGVLSADVTLMLSDYGKDEAIERFGTDDAKEIVKRMVVEDTPGFIKTKHPEWDSECHYLITKYSMKYVK
jgi:hypothetical protein